MSGYVILINAGHGGVNPKNNIFDVGAIKDLNSDGKIDTSNDAVEYYLNSKYANLLCDKVISNGGTVVFTQGSVYTLDDTYTKFEEEFSKQIKTGKVAQVSIHQDAYENTNYNGFTTRYQDGSNNALAQNIFEEIMQNGIKSLDTGKRITDVARVDNLYVNKRALEIGINNTTLVECSTISNTENAKQAMSNDYMSKIVNGIYDGLVKTLVQ